MTSVSAALPPEAARSETVLPGDVLWHPSAEFASASPVERFRRWVNARHGFDLADYEDLRRWSVSDIASFWAAIWDYFDVHAVSPYRQVIDSARMPGARWFEGARLNLAEHFLRHEPRLAAQPALIHANESDAVGQLSWAELGSQVRRLATALRAAGVESGDAVAAVLPNVPETVVAMLATVAIGAVWSVTPPEYGVAATVDRLAQLRPKVLIAVDGYRYGGVHHDRREVVAQIRQRVPSIRHLIQVAVPDPAHQGAFAHASPWADWLAGDDPGIGVFQYAYVESDHPLWVLFSSGTTGVPKAIVHGHAGVLLELYKLTAFHLRLQAGDRALFHSSSGWMMWNVLVASLLQGTTAVLYDGHPMIPDAEVLWRLCERLQVNVLAVSPAYVQLQRAQGQCPGQRYRLDRLTTMLLTGAPSSADVFAWCYQAVKSELWVTSQSGGTEIASALVAASPTLSVRAGEIQTRALGMDVQVWDREGRELVDRPGELVVLQPFPSMPLGFLDDPDGRRYHDAYFNAFAQTRRPVWRHGDEMSLHRHGGCVIHGRSDAMLNRYGVSFGPAEIYRSVQSVNGVIDGLTVACTMQGGRVFIPLFLKLQPGCALDGPMRQRILQTIRADASPRHVPDQLYVVDDIPYTMTGKRMEVPVRRLLAGEPLARVASLEAMANPQALQWFVQFRQVHAAMLDG